MTVIFHLYEYIRTSRKTLHTIKVEFHILKPLTIHQGYHTRSIYIDKPIHQ